jgi:peptidoglycan/LPS O-acetylase OafA/YrhL
MQKITRYQLGEVATALVLIVLLAAFITPPGLLMPKSTEMFLLVLFALAFFAYLGFIWKERAADEREHAHQLTAGRMSFFVGSSILTIGIISQALNHNIDPWLIGALGGMLLTKILVRLYTQITQ